MIEKVQFEYNGKKKNIKLEKANLKIYELNGVLDIVQYNCNEAEPKSIGNLIGYYVYNGSVVERKI